MSTQGGAQGEHRSVGHAVAVLLSPAALRTALVVLATVLVAAYGVAVLGILIDTEHGWDLVVPLVAHVVVTAAVALACWRLCNRAGRHVAERRGWSDGPAAEPAPLPDRHL